jgi:hypothetical protein
VPCTGASRIHALRSFIHRDGAAGRRVSPTPWFSLQMLPCSLHVWRELRCVRNTTGRSALLACRFPEQLPHLLQRFAFVLGAAGLRRPPRAFFVFDGIERDRVRLCRGQEGKGRRMASRAVDDVSADRPGRPGSSTSTWFVPQTLRDAAGMVRVARWTASAVTSTWFVPQTLRDTAGMVRVARWTASAVGMRRR